MSHLLYQLVHTEFLPSLEHPEGRPCRVSTGFMSEGEAHRWMALYRPGMPYSLYNEHRGRWQSKAPDRWEVPLYCDNKRCGERTFRRYDVGGDWLIPLCDKHAEGIESKS